MNRAVRAVAIFLAGASMGAGTVELIHRSTEQQSKLAFARKLRCQSLANDYVKNDNLRSDFISAVDYSPSRNSCVAAVLETMQPPTPIPGIKMVPIILLKTYEVRDLISQQGIWNTACEVGKDCEDSSKEMELEKELDDHFARAIAGRE